MLVTLTNTQQVDVTYGPPVDRHGSPAPIEAGSVVWQTSDKTVASVTPISEDPLSGTVVANLAGTCQIWPEADADLGDGVKTIAGEKLDVQVTGGSAVGFGEITVGTPVEQP